MGSRDAFVVVEQMKRRVARLLQLLLLVASPAGAAASAARHTVVSSPPPPVGPHSAPAQPHIAAGFASSNVFWPGDTDADGTVYQCAYIPTLVLANHTRLIAHGSCGTEANSCNGLHIQRATFAESRLDSDDRGLPRGTPGNPIQEGKICQKHSDNGGATWSKLRVVARGVDTGQIVWDDLRKVLVMQYSTVPKSEACPDCPGSGAVMEFKSTDLGAAPNKPDCWTANACAFARAVAFEWWLVRMPRRYMVQAAVPYRLAKWCRPRRACDRWLWSADAWRPDWGRRWVHLDLCGRSSAALVGK